MSVVRRGAVGAVVAGVVLLGGPAWAQEADPCAPGPDGQVPEMCQSGPAQPGSDTGTVGMEPEDPCAGSRPVEDGDGVVSDGGSDSEGIAVGEPAPGTEPGQEVPEGEPKPEPDEREPAPDQPASDSPGAVGEDGVVCAFAVPISAPGGAESAAGGGSVTAARGELPRTGPYDRLLALTAVGAGLVLAGAGATVVGRRRTA